MSISGFRCGFVAWCALAVSPGCGGDAVQDGSPPVDDDDPTGPNDTDDPTTPVVTTATDVCPTSVTLSTSAGVQSHEQRLHVALDAAAHTWVTCTSPDDPEELLLVESSAPATEHDLVVRGLLGDMAYDCEAHVRCGVVTGAASFGTGAVDSRLPALSATRNPAYDMAGDYTLFTTQEGCGGALAWAAFADPDGEIRWAYPIGEDLVSDLDAYLIEGGAPYGDGAVDGDQVHIGGGWGLFDDGQSNRGVFTTIDLSGKAMVSRELPDFGLGFNHHSEPLPDGSYLDITGTLDHLGNHEWNGIGIERWDPVGGVSWTWDSQPLVDSGFIDEPSAFDALPYHANAVSRLTDPLGDAVWVSVYGRQELWRLDEATGALTLVFGHGGDFELFDTDGEPLSDAEFPWVQHGPDYTSDGRILLYDNGQGRPGGSYSRVAEYQLDLAARRATLLWTWTEDGWYDPIIGDADYLADGHVLVTQGFSSCLDPFGDDVSEIVELEPPEGVVWKLTFPTKRFQVYRSQRYDGCDVFGNARYCVGISDRIASLQAASASGG